MTGVSRFGEVHRAPLGGAHPGWKYSKAENLTEPCHFTGAFDLLITAKEPEWFAGPAIGASRNSPSSCSSPLPFVKVHTEEGFERVGLTLAPLLPARIVARLPPALARPAGKIMIPFPRALTTPKIHVLAAAGLVDGGSCLNSESWNDHTKT